MGAVHPRGGLGTVISIARNIVKLAVGLHLTAFGYSTLTTRLQTHTHTTLPGQFMGTVGKPISGKENASTMV